MGIFVQERLKNSALALAWNKYHNPSIPVVFATVQLDKAIEA